MEKYTDLSFLKTFTGEDSNKMKKYISMFLNSASGIIDKINADAKSSDWRALKTSSHSIKTQLKYMGAEKAQSLAYEIEQLSDQGTNVDSINEKVGELTTVCNSVIAELNEEVEKL